ncbi:MAG: cell division protein FtsW [Acetobacteraceae bacterium]|nr:cell division protein FtsW [Acetobacteraceae bacterium]
MAFSRADNTPIARWWLTVDRWTLGALCCLVGCGYIMVLAASPAVAERIRASRELFIFKQLAFLATAFGIIIVVSMMPPRMVRRLAILGCGVALLATAMTLVFGIETKGAFRWISIAGSRIQPSEFLKPCFAMTTAWLLSRQRIRPGFHGTVIALCLFLAIVAILKKQPDVGMMAVIGAVFIIQLFVSGINLLWIGLGVSLAGGGGVMLYTLLPHVRRRFDQFMYGGKGGNYQIDRVMEAFANGGLFGKGAGEGTVKDSIPDVHADVVFAVVGEEFGLAVCLLLVGVFAFIVLRGLLRLMREQDLFVVLAGTGLIAGFGLQAMINLFSTLGMMPTKGITLPFISYGGSSAVAVGLGMGMFLSLTRPRARDERARERRIADGAAREEAA